MTKSVFARIYGALASLKLTIVLLSVLAIALIYGTFYESANGTPMAQSAVYTSSWFDALLALLFINMVACTARKYPYRPHQLGFLMVHVGVLTILVGAVLTRHFGHEGQLWLYEGDSGDAATSARPYLAVSVTEDRVDGHLFPLAFPAKDAGAVVDRTLRVPGSPVQLQVSRYFPNARETEVVTAGGDDNPAVHLRCTRHDETSDVWLLPGDPDCRAVIDPLGVEAFAAPNAEVADSLLGALAMPRSGGRGTLEIRGDGLPKRSIPLDGTLPRTVAAGDYRVVLLQWFSHLVVRDGMPVNASEVLANPAILFEVQGTRGAENHVAFALHPMNTLVTPESDHGYHIDAHYVHEGAAAADPHVRLVHTTGGGWRLAANFDLDIPADRRLELGRTYASATTHIELQAIEALERAVVRQDFVNVDRQEHRPALLVGVTNGNERSEPVWVYEGNSPRVRLGDRTVTLEMRQCRLPLGFTVQLVDFAETTYPGTSRSATFASDVLVTDPGSSPVPIHISMNKPLKHRGLRLFQASYARQGGREASVFSVSYDPGVTVVYTGFIIFIAGLVVIFYLKPLIKKAYLPAARGRKERS
jgi:hypothetical protein